MKLSFSLSKITPQISRDRLKGYKWILSGQLSVVIVFLFFYEYFNRYPFDGWQPFLLSVVGIVMFVMNVLTYALLKDLTSSKFVQFLVLFMLFSGVFLGLLAGAGLVEPGTAAYQNISAISIIFSLWSFIILLYFMIIDIFREQHDITYRLWGCASIYLLIGSTFGLVFTLMEIYLPKEFGLASTNSLFDFIPCYNFSFYNLAGIDSPFNFSLLVKNVAVFESIVSNLYIVLVVGRLLSR